VRNSFGARMEPLRAAMEWDFLARHRARRFPEFAPGYPAIVCPGLQFLSCFQRASFFIVAPIAA
jgi:hypothetical protein